MAGLKLGRREVRRRWGYTGAGLTLVAVLLLALGSAVAGNPAQQSLFELDGNALADANVAGDDWQNIVGQTPTGSTVTGGPVATSFIGQFEDPDGTGPATAEGPLADNNYFTGGGSKDVRDVTDWLYGGSSVPDKNQITNAYAAQYAKSGSQYVYFGADRFSNDGDSSLGFWFFKSEVKLGANGAFIGKHENGDVFIVSDFSNGGSVGTVKAYKWEDGNVVPMAGGDGGDCAAANSASFNVCGRVNAGPTTSPWNYTPKANVGSAGTFPANTFFEGGIDLTALSGGQVCFSSFLAETRSSTSVTAQLKDFALGGFDTCSAKISIRPSGVNAVGTNHTFTVKVERSFGGDFAGVQGRTVTGSIAAGSVGSFVGGNTCTTNAAGECNLVVTSNAAGTTTVTATATVPFTGTSDETVTTNGQNGSSGPATKRWVDAAIRVTPSAVNEVGNQHKFDIEVTPSQTAGTTVKTISITPTITPAGFTPVSDTCANPTLASGKYTCSVTINSSSAGTFTANASTTIVYEGQPGDEPLTATVTRSTTSDSALQATKRFVDASITIDPDDTNSIGENHTFTVTVKKDLGMGDGLVAAQGVNPTVTLTPNAAVAPGKTDTCASPGTDANGKCSVTFTSNTAGTIVGNASVSLNLGSAQDPVVRSTAAGGNSGPGGSGSATKICVAGTLRWLKVDQDNQPLGGATFQVCRTHTFNSSTAPASFDAVTPPGSACQSVTDNQGPDADNDPGELQLNGLILGRYTIAETQAPAGYQKDDTIHTVELTIANPSNAASPPTFVNVRLFRLIVLTCNQATNELVKSQADVTINGQVVSKDTLAAGDNLGGLTQAQLCGIGGARYGDLRAGTYQGSVQIPKGP